MKFRWMGIMLAGALTASLAHAGTKFDFPITVTKNPDGSGIFRGSVASTRNMPNVNAQTSCSVGASATFKFAVCFGSDGTQSLICSTSNANLVDVASRLAGDSHLTVEVDATGGCKSIQVETGSSLLPKTP